VRVDVENGSNSLLTSSGGMLSSFDMANAHTTCVAVAHNCQVTDAMLRPQVFDTVCDLVFYTNTSYRRRPLQLMPATKSELWHLVASAAGQRAWRWSSTERTTGARAFSKT
jgi:hypothetical protein